MKSIFRFCFENQYQNKAIIQAKKAEITLKLQQQIIGGSLSVWLKQA